MVAGIRNTEDLDDLQRRMPDMHAELIDSLAQLEAHYRDIQDIEFTIEDGRLYILQTRGAKRHAKAAVQFASDAVREGLLSREHALRTIRPGTLTALLHPAFAPDAEFEELTRGVPASPGAAIGVIALTAQAAQDRAAEGEDSILVRMFTSADEIRTLGVRTNADTAEDARHAIEMGAEGIGLCRTEHMFFGADREVLVREMFIAGELARRERLHFDGGDGGPLESEFAEGLGRLGEIQRQDFKALLEVMNGLPVTIRLLDPPLHEFIPVSGFERELSEARERGDKAAAGRASVRLAVARDLEEVNPMLGSRGARLGILLRGLYEMQTRAIVEAALDVASEGGAEPKVEIMLPLIAFESELELLREGVDRTISEVLEQRGAELEVPVGTMIELPRACLVAEQIAEKADFFSFGTNDLTQTALGLSRDDAERVFLPEYLSRGLVPTSPFETIDIEGVGALVRIAAGKGRAAKPGLPLGVCGEHGGDPASVEFFHAAGLDYVSCSPYRIPVARVAAARAALD